MKRRRWSVPQILWLAVAALVFLDLGAGVWAFQHIRSVRSEIAALQQQATALQAASRDAPATGAGVAQAQRELDSVLTQLPRSPTPLDLALALGQAAARHHLTVAALSCDSPHLGKSGLLEFPVSLTLAVPAPEDLAAFVADLERGPPPVTIPLTQLSFRPGTTVSLHLQFYGRPAT